MKKSINASMIYKRGAHRQRQIKFTPPLFVILLLSIVLVPGCSKQEKVETQNETQAKSNAAVNVDDELRTFYTGLDPQTLWELQQVRAATARYRDARNAFKDNYVDIGLKLPNMGYHFLKSALVTPEFDLRKPPILVYNKRENGSFELLAVEYAIPIDQQHPDIAPEGFTGNDDEWNFNTLNTGWWTLHAWVWKNNPDGVFMPMNPDVQVR
jgi:hypothetical protein